MPEVAVKRYHKKGLWFLQTIRSEHPITPLVFYRVTKKPTQSAGVWKLASVCYHGPVPCRMALNTAPGFAQATRVRGRGDPGDLVEPRAVLNPLGLLGKATHHFVPCFPLSGPLA